MTRIQQILINIGRMRWMPADRDKKIILVNIPGFRLQVMDSGRDVLAMNIVVGKEGHNTVLFSGYLDRVVFNPYWNIPASIVRKEIGPELEKHPDYLEEHDMEITGHAGGLPVIRQLPGDKNELGRIKFVFPNNFNIYLHDSPHKELFNMRKRAYSHGCIRVEDARGLAAYLLPDHSKEEIDKIIGTQKEKAVKIKEPVAVLITYFTVWNGDDDRLQFREDIYGHDKRVARMLFTRSEIK
jgi:murein L,D-transpeptidase YcbB/YkuD